MHSNKRLGNLFDDDSTSEDSFDMAAVHSGKDNFNTAIRSKQACPTEADGSECDFGKNPVDLRRDLDLNEEDFDIVTIEKVPLNVLTTRIRRVFTEVCYRGEPAAAALFDVANMILFQSTMLDIKRNTVIDAIIQGITSVIVDVRERDQGAEQAEHILMQFISKLSIKNKSMKCSDLLYQLILLIDRLHLHADSFVRSRIYHLVAVLIEESNSYADLLRENGDAVFLTDEDSRESEVIIPSAVKNRWIENIVKSLFDKSPLVRCKAVQTISLLDHDTICKTTNYDKISVNELIWKSMHDMDEAVRVTAARRVHIVDERGIDKCLDYVEASRDNRVKQVMLSRMVSDVHLFSFSEKQRFRLVNLLYDSESARAKSLIHQRLVNSWMKVAGDEIVSPSIFPTATSEHKIPKQFPSIILDYLDPLQDTIAVYVFMKFVTLRFILNINGQPSGSPDVDKFMKNLLKMANADCESVGLMRRTTFRLVNHEPEMKKNEFRKTFTRVLITRCFVDVVFDSAKGRLNAAHLRNRALMFFLPDVTTFSENLIEFCSVFFKESEELQDANQELLLYNIFHLMNLAVKFGDSADDVIVYKKVLMQLLADPTLEFSRDTVLTMMSTSLDLCKTLQEKELFCIWICETARKLMLYETDEEKKELQSLERAMKNGQVLDRMYLRGATMLLATCQHEEVEAPTKEMSSLFKAVIPALLGNRNESLLKVGLELIGFATSIDFSNCGPYLKLTSFLIKRDDEVLKSTGIHALVQVVKTHGFPKTAEAIFLEESNNRQDCQEALANVFEKTLISLQGTVLVQSVQDCLSMLSYGHYAWPKLYSAVLLIVFKKSNEGLPLIKILKKYCKKSIKSNFNKLNILLGFMKAISIISRVSEHDADWDLAAMTEIVCDCISTVHTIDDDGCESLAKKKNGEEQLYLEIVLANRIISRAASHPTAWFIRHVFTSMVTALRLESVPLEQLDQLHNYLIDSYTIIRFNSTKTTQIAFKRFLTQCEKVIMLHERMKGLKMDVDLKEVKKEFEDVEDVSPISGRKRGRPRMHSERDDNTDDSFEYFPKSTRTRKRPAILIDASSKQIKEEIVEECLNMDDSFEL